MPAPLPSPSARRLSIGAEPVAGGISFRVWAPGKHRVAVVVDGREFPLRSEPDGYWSATLSGIAPGARYGFRLNAAQEVLPDPASRFQPDGPDALSQIVDPVAYRWQAQDWPGAELDNPIVYELHIGSFTREGTWRAALARLPHLRELGITTIELMPVNEFRGRWGWSYDGVLPFAPTRNYGTPDEFKAFIDHAHSLELGVVLDVVYNHFGDSNRFEDFTPSYFTEKHQNDWGKSLNFDGPNAHGVRSFIASNVAYWIEEFRLDGLRLDATQALLDNSDEHIITLISRTACEVAKGRRIWLVGENEPQLSKLVRGESQAGYNLSAVWNDDFHHSAMVALTGRREAYYHDYAGRPQEFIAALKHGYLFQGQRYDWQDFSRGTPGLDLVPANFVHFVQNHDQIANSGTGQRLSRLASPAAVRAMTAVLLLGPQTPMLFQGQEFGATTPFRFFSDPSSDKAANIAKGRIDELSQFPSLTDAALVASMPDPTEGSTFQGCKLDWHERDANPHIFALHRDLLELRRTDPALTHARHGSRRVDGSVLSEDAFLLRFFGPEPADDRLLLVNLGRDLVIRSIPDPLAAPPEGKDWDLLWSSEDAAYGGSGRWPVDLNKRFVLTGNAALLFGSVPAKQRQKPSKAQLTAWQRHIA